MIGNVRKRLHDAFDIDVPHNRLKKLKISYVENDWKFPEEKKKSGRPRMLSPFGEKQVLSDITGHTQRATARNCEFESNKENCMVSPSRTTLGRVAKRGGLVIAEPKIVRITKYSDHHKKMRVLHAQWFLALPQVQQQQIWYSDEMGFPVTRTPNKKICDCQPELKGRFVPSAAPDDNLIENVNGYLRQTLWQMCQSGEEEWKGSVETKMNIIRRAINKINNDRSYFWRLYRSHPDRCRRIIVSGGEIS